jgi:hypothetical protein
MIFSEFPGRRGGARRRHRGQAGAAGSRRRGQRVRVPGQLPAGDRGARQTSHFVDVPGLPNVDSGLRDLKHRHPSAGVDRERGDSRGHHGLPDSGARPGHHQHSHLTGPPSTAASVYATCSKSGPVSAA